MCIVSHVTCHVIKITDALENPDTLFGNPNEIPLASCDSLLLNSKHLLPMYMVAKDLFLRSAIFSQSGLKSFSQ